MQPHQDSFDAACKILKECAQDELLAFLEKLGKSSAQGNNLAT